MLSDRFQEAIDMAAMRGGASDTDAYLADWRRAEPVAVGDDLAAEADKAKAEIETAYDKERLKTLIANGGAQPDSSTAKDRHDPHARRLRHQGSTSSASTGRSCVIGERINPTGRKKLAAEMEAGNFETVIKDALAQVAAGAHILDVNAGVTAVNPNETEPPLLGRRSRSCSR